MDNLRSNVVKKVANFMRVAQPVPPPPPPTDAAPPGAAPMPPKAPPRPPMPGGAPGGAPPGGAPAPGAAPPPPPISPAEQGAEKDKAQGVRLDKVEQALTQNNDKMEALVDAVVEMKQIIEQGILGEPGMDDKLKKLKEKQKKNEMTSEEFGLDEDKSIVSKEERNMATEARELRQARKGRLAGDLKYHSDKYDPQGLKFEDADHENKKYKQEVPAPVITKVKKDETPELFRIALDLSDDESKWSIVDKPTEKILYEIQKTDANSEGFNTEAFARAVIADMKTLGIAAAMKKHGALPMMLDKGPIGGPGGPGGDKGPMADKVPEKLKNLKTQIGDKENDVKDSMKDALKDKVIKKDKGGPLNLIKKDLPLSDLKKEESLQSNADIQRRFLRAFRVALSAQQKNLIDNPLKAAWFHALTSMNIAEPTRLIEATFSQAALDQFEVALNKAEEYLALSDEAFIETESTIGDFRTTAPAEEAVEPAIRQAAVAMRERAKKASLVVSTASDSDASDRALAISQAVPMPKLAGISRFARR